ncbi:MAG: hypothetical protein U5K51_07240 [Flavobacteriaceae bacterium]|nr:hypothetical protein [Flavobacteriaceae bacterium]
MSKKNKTTPKLRTYGEHFLQGLERKQETGQSQLVKAWQKFKVIESGNRRQETGDRR